MLEGKVRFFCEGYEPVLLDVGDSVYFDASVPHRYLQGGAESARMLCVYSHPEHARLDQRSEVQPHSLAMRALGGEQETPPAVLDAPVERRRARG